MEIRPIDGSFAREVSGLDLWRELPEPTVAALRDAWTRHGVLVFRRQSLSEDEYAAFAGNFGTLDVTVRTDWGSKHRPEVIHISNMRNGRGESIGGLGAGELDWHTDQSYVANPSTGSMLYMVEMPPAGGRTWWANLQLAWEALPGAKKRRIEPLHVVYDYLLRQSTYDDEAPMSEELRRRTPPVSHPLVNVHPVTGEKALYLDPVTAAGIEGWPEDESRGAPRGDPRPRDAGPLRVRPRVADRRRRHVGQRLPHAPPGRVRSRGPPLAQAHHLVPPPRAPHRPAVPPRDIALGSHRPVAAAAAGRSGTGMRNRPPDRRSAACEQTLRALVVTLRV